MTNPSQLSSSIKEPHAAPSDVVSATQGSVLLCMQNTSLLKNAFEN
jgi:hypothetical protein